MSLPPMRLPLCISRMTSRPRSPLHAVLGTSACATDEAVNAAVATRPASHLFTSRPPSPGGARHRGDQPITLHAPGDLEHRAPLGVAAGPLPRVVGGRGREHHAELLRGGV